MWTKASVASPNVRHEAIIAREAEKILPVMVDDLKPTDFPMGLFMVQALLIGAAAPVQPVTSKFLDECGPGSAPATRSRRRSRAHGKDRAAVFGLGVGACWLRRCGRLPALFLAPPPPPAGADTLPTRPR